MVLKIAVYVTLLFSIVGATTLLTLFASGGSTTDVNVEIEASSQEQQAQVRADTPEMINSNSPDEVHQVAGAASAERMTFSREKVTEGEGRWPFVPLDDPEFVTADEADLVDPQDLVLEAYINNEAKAYPTSMMWFHHVANDTIGGEPVAVTY